MRLINFVPYPILAGGQNPNINALILPTTAATASQVAFVDVPNVVVNDLVLLQGLFHINNTTPGPVSINVITRIFKDGSVIYRSEIEVDFIGGDDSGQPIPILLVDKITVSTNTVNYTVEVFSDTAGAIGSIRRPLAFTASQFR